MPIRNRPQRLQKIQFRKLKNLENLEISFENKHITGIFGTNGSGKSTILHALACLYQPVANSTRRNFKFPNFFIPTTLDLWNGSQFTIEYEMINGAAMAPERKEYKKNRDRWSPRYQTRPHREVFYIGIDSCVPDMEIESRTSRIPLIREAYDDAVLGEKIKEKLSFIMHRNYGDFINYWNERKSYKGLTYGAVQYPSLYMGAGEQRIIKFLETIYSIPDYSLILIDELYLTLHTEALLRLMQVLNDECNTRNIQIVFTSHREELLDCNFINIRHLVNDTNGKTSICLERTTPDCIKRLTGICPKPLEIMVEDNLAEALVRKILRTHNLEQSCKVSQFGSKENSYLVGAGLLLRGETLDNTLIVLDGDVDVAEAEKRTKINRVITGTDNDSQQRRDKLLSKIKQFCLPVNRKPEEFITDELKTLDDAVHSLIPHIKATGPVQDHHDLLNTPITNSGMPEQTAFAEIVTLMEHRPCWANYVAEIDDWVVDKKQN